MPIAQALVALIERWLAWRGRPAKPQRPDICALSQHMRRDIGYENTICPKNDDWKTFR
jgi:hypothetical protein